MNWSTRLRRWVRISTPPVREASTKPSAATVLPAPVACSNQNRRSALGSSGAPSRDVRVDPVVLLPVLRLLVLVDSPSSSRRPPPLELLGPRSRSRSSSSGPPRAPPARPCAAPVRRCAPVPLRGASASSAVSVPESASTWCADRTVPSTRCGSSSDSTARARAAASTGAATRARAAWRRPRPRRARSRAPADEPTPGQGPPRGFRPRRRTAHV